MTSVTSVYTAAVKGYLIKAPEGMLERWKRVSHIRKMSTSQMVREAVNKDIDQYEASLKPFDAQCSHESSHEEGARCKWCSGSITPGRV